MTTVKASCLARASIAGNPSDGYGGAVVSVPVPALSATVTVAAAERFEITPSPTGDDTFGDVDELVDHVDRFGYGSARDLVLASIRSLVRLADAPIAPCRVTVGTTIPRSVGLAGSSAIVIATMRALAVRVEHERWAATLLAEPDWLASMALHAETGELGITAGLQDRVVQARGAPTLMEFGDGAMRRIHGLDAGTYRNLPSLPVDPDAAFLAYRRSAAQQSGAVHQGLSVRAGEAAVVAAMEDLARQAQRAATAMEIGDLEAVGDAMNASFEARSNAMQLDPSHVEMVAAAQAAGAAANYAGSGGAITVVAPSSEIAAHARKVLADELDCTIVALG